MNTKAFMLLLVAVLVLGGSLGGAFVGGMALGKSQGEDSTSSGEPAQPASSLNLPSSGESDTSALGQFRQQFQSGELDQEDLDQLLQQFQGQFGPGFGGGGFAGGRGLTGTIESVEGDVVTVNTPQGLLQATIGAGTTIQMFAEGTLADLEAGLRVTLTGEPNEDGIVEATSILLTPGGTGGFLGEGFSRGDSFQQEGESP